MIKGYLCDVQDIFRRHEAIPCGLGPEAALGLGHPASRVDLIPECNSKCGICVGHNVPSLKQKLVGGLEQPCGPNLPVVRLSLLIGSVCSLHSCHVVLFHGLFADFQ